MSYFELILQRPLENIPALLLIILGFIDLARRVLGFLSGLQKDSTSLQTGSQAIISQDNTLQSKLIEFMGDFQKEHSSRRLVEDGFRAQDIQFRKEMLAVIDEKMARIDGTTLRIDGTTLATSAEIKAMVVKMDKFDKAMGIFYQALKKKGLI